MKNANLPQSKPTKRFVLSFFLLGSVMLSLTFIAQNTRAQQQVSLSLADLLIALRSKKATLPERNTILAEAVKKRGITFSLTPEIEKELETTGADKQLVEAVRQKGQIIKIAATSMPKPEPVSAATPRPPDFSFYQNRANAHFVKGEFDLAVINYNKVIEINPREISAYMSRASAFNNKEYFDKAVADYDKVIELSPEEAAAYFKRAAAYEKLGDKAKALADYKKAVEFDSANTAAKNSLQRLEAEQAKLLPQPVAQPAAPTVAANTNKIPEIVDVGSLKELAVKLAIPFYPAADKLRKTQGFVKVQITLDEEGKVISADAEEGPPSLRSSSEDAARRSKFKPAMVGTTAVKSKGYITYNFKAQ